jgi:hypothetical protein
MARGLHEHSLAVILEHKEALTDSLTVIPAHKEALTDFLAVIPAQAGIQYIQSPGCRPAPA